MITPEKIKAIKKQLRRGEPEGEIKEQMKVAGYSDDEIAQAFIPHPYDMRAWYLTFAILLLLLGVIVFINTGGFFLFLLSGYLFYCYHRECQRLERLKQL